MSLRPPLKTKGRPVGGLFHMIASALQFRFHGGWVVLRYLERRLRRCDDGMVKRGGGRAWAQNTVMFCRFAAQQETSKMFNRRAGGRAFCHGEAVGGAQSLKHGTTMIAFKVKACPSVILLGDRPIRLDCCGQRSGQILMPVMRCFDHPLILCHPEYCHS